MNLEEVLARIEERLAALDMNPTEASRLAGKPDSIRNFRRAVASGKPGGMNTTTLAALAPVLRTTPEWLTNGGGNPPIPLLSWVAASKLAEFGEVKDGDDIEYIPNIDLGPGNWICLRVVGDSMDRIAPDGSKIFIDLNDKALSDGGYYVCHNRGQATFKRYRKTNGFQRLVPFSTNPNHDDVFVEGDLQIVGRVRRVVSDL